MPRNLDVQAQLSLSTEEHLIDIQAAEGKMTIHFQKMSISAICREVSVLDRLHVLDTFRSLSEAGGLRVYIKYGFLRLPMPGPALMRSIVWFGHVFFKPGRRAKSA